VQQGVPSTQLAQDAGTHPASLDPASPAELPLEEPLDEPLEEPPLDEPPLEEPPLDEPPLEEPPLDELLGVSAAVKHAA
jgi:hypothetical protein